MRVRGARRLHVPGWTGPVLEDAEPGTIEGRGALEDGLNLMARSGGRRVVRGGSRVACTFGAVSSNPITDCWGPFRYSATGAVAVGHAAAGSKHYAYALTDELAWAAATEALSRGDLSWNSATPARPLAVELFEKTYFVDASDIPARQGMSVGVWSSGAWTVSQPTFDLDGSGGSPGVLRAYSAEVFNGVLFVSGYDSESAPASGSAPHLLRHSLLGTDPSASGGFDPNAYLILGAKGAYVRAMKAGRTALMAAKDSELYLLTGAGRSLPGWQYQVQSVSNSLGAGCTNPYALDHAYGMWYGIGRVGPWRSDGGNVDLLRIGRDRSWSTTQNLQLATVTAHPDRRQVWFGFHEVGRSGYAVAPCTFWVWDIEREQWDVSQRTNRSYTFLGSVLQGAGVAPSGAPGAPVQDEEDDAFDLAALEVTWTPADSSAETQVWYRDSVSGSSVPFATIAAGINRARITGLSSSASYYVKVRHTRAGIDSDFSSETLCYTRLAPCIVSAGSTATTDVEPVRTILSYNPRAGATVTVADDRTGGDKYQQVYTSEPLGQRTATDAVLPFGRDYTCALHEPLWPSGKQDALTATCHQYEIGITAPPKITQVLNYGLYDTTLQVQFWPNRHGDTYQFELSTNGLSYTLAATFVAPTAGNPLEVIISGVAAPTAGTEYYTRVTNVTTGVSTTGPQMFTKIPAPTAVSVTSSGAGTPVVNVAVTAPMAGHKARIYNDDRSYDTTTGSNLSVGVNNFGTTAGVCGQMDRYTVRLYNAAWPLGHRYSDPVSDTVANPCAVGT